MSRRRIPEPGSIEAAARRFRLAPATVRRYIRRGAPASIAVEFAAYLGLDSHALVYGTRLGRVTAHRSPAAVGAGPGAATPTLPRRKHNNQTPILTVIPGSRTG